MASINQLPFSLKNNLLFTAEKKIQPIEQIKSTTTIWNPKNLKYFITKTYCHKLSELKCLHLLSVEDSVCWRLKAVSNSYSPCCVFSYFRKTRPTQNKIFSLHYCVNLCISISTCIATVVNDPPSPPKQTTEQIFCSTTSQFVTVTVPDTVSQRLLLFDEPRLLPHCAADTNNNQLWLLLVIMT